MRLSNITESDISGLLSAARDYNKVFRITAELAEGGVKKFKVKAQSERVAREKFLKHASMAKILKVEDITNESVNEAGEDTFMSALKGLKSWQVVIMNNYYRGKYSDYSGRYYYVLASSPEEAKQVVLDNADAILQDLLSMKSVNGKKILPRSSAIPITDKRIGEIKDGTEAGRMSTAGFKRMFGPQGPMMVKLSGGAVVDVQGQEQGVAEGDHPKTWHDVDPKLGKAVDKMSQAEKVKKGLAHPDTLNTEKVYKVVALDKSNALKKPTKLNVKASSIEDVFSRLAANDWYALSINGVEVVAGKRLKQGVAEGSDYQSYLDKYSNSKSKKPLMTKTEFDTLQRKKEDDKKYKRVNGVIVGRKGVAEGSEFEDAYDKGYRDGYDGKGYNSPFPVGSDQDDEYEDGYSSGRLDYNKMNQDLDEQGVAEGEYKSRHIHRQEQNKKYDEYCRSQEAAGKKPMSRGDWAATQRKGQKQGVAEGSSDRRKQEQEADKWLEKRIMKCTCPTSARNNPKCPVHGKKKGVAEGSDNIRSMIQQYEDMVELVYDLPPGRKKNIAIDKRDALEAQIEAMPGGKEALRKWARAYNDSFDEGVAEGSLEEYGNTARGQKMLTKVHKRAVDRVIKADDKNRLEPDYTKRDLKTVRKNQATADRAWDRMSDLDEQGVAEGYPKHQDLSGISTDKLKAYLDKQSKQQVSGEGNQIKRVRAELQRREQGVTEVSTELRNRYVTRASSDYGHANFGARMSKDDPNLQDYHKEQARRAQKRAAGLNRALSDKRLGRDVAEAGTLAGTLTLKDKSDYMARRKAIQDMQMDPEFGRNPRLKAEIMKLRAELEKAAKAKGLVAEDASGLNVGDPVVITGNVSFKGKTGDIVSFGRNNAFVVVDLYNHGKHSFHSSDVSFNDYAGSDDEEARMYDAGEFRDDVDEGYLDRPGQEDSPVAQAITRRILLQRTDLLAKYGPEKVMSAIDEVADFVGDVDEIGSSDVSGWVRHVEQILGNMEESKLESEDQGPKSALGKALWRDLSKFKKASPVQQQRNKERWAANPNNPINKAGK